MSKAQSQSGPRVELDGRGNPIFISVPTTDYIRQILPTDSEGVAEIHNYLRVYGMESASELASFERQYLSRFNITPGSPGYEARLQQLSEESYSDKVAVAMARRTAQQADTLAALEGHLDSQCVYINDGKNPCSECEKLNGAEGLYTEFVAEGKLPADRCLGGNLCACVLQPVTV